MAYTHLHLHTDYSVLDGFGKIKDYVKKAKDMGMTALAITDHGTMSGVVEFFDECKKAGIKPLIGSEFYEAPVSRSDKDSSNKYYHLVLIAKNEEGYKNLCYLTTRANTEGFYYKPRIDRELLESHHEGLVCLSACLQGRIATDIREGNIAQAEADVMWYKSVFGKDFYLEIQNHGLADEISVAGAVYSLGKKTDTKVVCTNDCHYVDKADAEAHEWLLCSQTDKRINEPHMKYEGDYSLRSEAEMRALYPSMPEAFDNTMEVAEKCDFEFHYAHSPKDYNMPEVSVPKEYEEYGEDRFFRYMKDLANAGFEFRYKDSPIREKARAQLDYEFSVVEKMGFAKYFLNIRETIVWAKDNGILVGVGRGSGAGSVLNYCLKITDIEPLKYGLLFERFLNPDRISMPDIDTDFEKRFKDDVLRSEAERSGITNFAKIRTFGTLKAKGCIKEVLRVSGIDDYVNIGAKISKMIGNDQKITLQKAYDTNPELKAYVENNGLQKIWQIALKLEGTKKSEGTHACGHIPTPVPCEELFPCSVDSKTGYLVCQYNMTEAEHLGNLKKDLLMLRNLTIISIAEEQIKKNYGREIPHWTEEILEDKNTLKMFGRSDTNGVFQFESDGMKDMLKNLKPACFEDIVAGVSLYRPGPMDYIPEYIRGKNNPNRVHYDHELLKPILQNTYGVFVYQEQIMQAVQALAGFTKGEADTIRKAMGKKKMDVMDEMEVKYMAGCKERGVSERDAGIIWDKMKKFAEYAFNKSHAVAYSAISMQTAYLKCYYEAEYYAGLLTSVMDDTEKVSKYVRDCREKGIEVLPPDINTGGENFVVSGGKIYYGLSAIKGLGKITEKIISEREENGDYLGLFDFMYRTGANKKVLESLIYAGAFDFTGINRPTLVNHIPIYQKDIKAEEKLLSKMVDGQMSIFDLLEDKGESGYVSLGLPTRMHKADYLKAEPKTFSNTEKYFMEKAVTGLFISGNPLDENKPSDIDYTPLTEIVGSGDRTETFTDENGDTVTIERDNDDTITKRTGDMVCIRGIVSENKMMLSKSGRPYVRMKLEDDITSVTVFAYADNVSKVNVSGGDIVTIVGKVHEYNGVNNISLHDCYLDKDLDRCIIVRPDRKCDLFEIKKALADGKQDVLNKGLFPVYRYYDGVISHVGNVNDIDIAMNSLYAYDRQISARNFVFEKEQTKEKDKDLIKQKIKPCPEMT